MIILLDHDAPARLAWGSETEPIEYCVKLNAFDRCVGEWLEVYNLAKEGGVLISAENIHPAYSSVIAAVSKVNADLLEARQSAIANRRT